MLSDEVDIGKVSNVPFFLGDRCLFPGFPRVGFELREKAAEFVDECVELSASFVSYSREAVDLEMREAEEVGDGDEVKPMKSGV